VKQPSRLARLPLPLVKLPLTLALLPLTQARRRLQPTLLLQPVTLPLPLAKLPPLLVKPLRKPRLLPSSNPTAVIAGRMTCGH